MGRAMEMVAEIELMPVCNLDMARRHRSSMQLQVLRTCAQCWWRNSDGAIGLES
jgi:hypothetical protein